MSLKQQLLSDGQGLPASFQPQPDGTLSLEVLVAQRKAFLTRKKLIYRSRLRIDETQKKVIFFEMLKEKGWGVSSGSNDDISPGIGFKKETYKIGGQEREGTIEEQSRLFGKDYQYTFDFARIRNIVRQLAASQDYGFEVCLREKAILS